MRRETIKRAKGRAQEERKDIVQYDEESIEKYKNKGGRKIKKVEERR